jgi:hypothetical protein
MVLPKNKPQRFGWFIIGFAPFDIIRLAGGVTFPVSILG